MRSGQVKLEKQAKGGSAWELGRREKQARARARIKATARNNWTGPLCNQTTGNVTGWSVM